jgi:signal transduction histidine kinase/methylmalonyl-CoA mutase cobalamin-binding subunit
MSGTPAPSGKVLVLEDDPGIRRLERSALERHGYRVELAANISEARAVLAGGGIDLLLLDYRLEEGENGLEFYRQLQAEGRDLPAILVTGFGDEQRIAEALRLGVRDFIPKALNFYELVPATVERVLTLVQQERRLQEAETASRAKDDFLATLSHELRTPLTPVLALVSQLRTDARLPEEVREDLTTIHRNVELEARLIDDLLDLTRITRGKLELRAETVDLRPLVEHAVKTCFTAEALKKEIVFRSVLPAEPMPVRGDSARLTQVLWNLLKNAIKFTPPQGSITLSAGVEKRGDRSWIVVRVADSGLGIEQSVLPRIFGAFEQGNRAITRCYGGLGLGLAISKAIMDLHGGEISAESAGPGQGATFSIWLPLLALPAGSGPVSDRAVVAASAAPAPESRAGRLLLVEDHRDTAAIMARMLRRAGFEVTAAGGVADALAKMETLCAANGVPGAAPHPLPLVVSDLGLPDGSGLELMAALLQKHPVRGIALSGFGMEEDVRRSQEAGFSRHLTKPINLETLIATIREVAAS